MHKRASTIHAEREKEHAHSTCILCIPPASSKGTASPFPGSSERKNQSKGMKVSKVATLTVLLMQFCFLTKAGGRLAGKAPLPEDSPAGAAVPKKTLNPSHEEDREAEVRRQPSARLWKAVEDAGAGGGAQDKGASKALLGTSKLKASGKRQMSQPSLPKSKTPGLQTHLKGHGQFNTDTYSCPGIQLKACRKPSDCDGCLGLYTCKLPRGKCDLKAVSRQTDNSGGAEQEQWQKPLLTCLLAACGASGSDDKKADDEQ